MQTNEIIVTIGNQFSCFLGERNSIDPEIAMMFGDEPKFPEGTKVKDVVERVLELRSVDLDPDVYKHIQDILYVNQDEWRAQGYRNGYKDGRLAGFFILGGTLIAIMVCMLIGRWTG